MSSTSEELPAPPAGFRWWQPADAPALDAAWRDDEIRRWNPVPDGLTAERWIAGVHARWTRRLALDLVIERDGAVVGEVGLSGFAHEPARAELGVWVDRSQRNGGVATSAVRAVVRWALDELGLVLVFARTHVDNTAGAATMAAAGFVEAGRHGDDIVWRSPGPADT